MILVIRAKMGRRLPAELEEDMVASMAYRLGIEFEDVEVGYEEEEE